MRRRKFLSGVAAAGAAGLAGCSSLVQTRAVNVPPVVKGRPDAVYIPSHIEGMKMSGTASSGGLRCALTYSYPHRFWVTSGDRTRKVSIRKDDAMHLMPIVWHAETGIIPPTMNPQVEISQDGETVTSLSPWPMLSQPMGYHFGDNVELPGDGTYTVTVTTGGSSVKTTSRLADVSHSATFTFELDYAREKVMEVEFTMFPERKGTPDAVHTMKMDMVPTSHVPTPNQLPGRRLGRAESGDAVFVATALDDATRFGGTSDQSYLAVSPRTPYNLYPLPMMSLSATLERAGETVFEGPLEPALDDDLHYHYGAVVSDARADDSLRVTVNAPPQIARHEGYETAFIDMPPMELE